MKHWLLLSLGCYGASWCTSVGCILPCDVSLTVTPGDWTPGGQSRRLSEKTHSTVWVTDTHSFIQQQPSFVSFTLQTWYHHLHIILKTISCISSMSDLLRLSFRLSDTHYRLFASWVLKHHILFEQISFVSLYTFSFHINRDSIILFKAVPVAALSQLWMLTVHQHQC